MAFFDVLFVHLPFFEVCEMTVKNWFKTGCDYQTGVDLYERIGRNKNLLRRFRRVENPATISKLKYELSKFIEEETQPPTPVVKPKPIVFTPPKIIVEKPPIAAPKESDQLKEMKSKPISFYPLELHAVYHQRINSFLQACTLKIQLNDLNDDEVGKAFEIQFKIFSLFELNDKCWKILRHFEETGRVMPLKTSQDFSKLNPMELLRLQQNIYSRISKRKKTIQRYESSLTIEKNLAKTESLKKNILKKTEELQQLENDLEAISKLIQSKSYGKITP